VPLAGGSIPDRGGTLPTISNRCDLIREPSIPHQISYKLSKKPVSCPGLSRLLRALATSVLLLAGKIPAPYEQQRRSSFRLRFEYFVADTVVPFVPELTW